MKMGGYMYYLGCIGARRLHLGNEVFLLYAVYTEHHRSTDKQRQGPGSRGRRGLKYMLVKELVSTVVVRTKCMLKIIVVLIVIQNMKTGGAGKQRAPEPTRGVKGAISVTAEAAETK